MKRRLLYSIYTYLRKHEESCHFFDDFGLLIQALLGIICVSALLIKRSIENPKRPWKIWFLDSSKQAIGQLTQHFSNLLFANTLGDLTGLECEWYITNLICDATLGVFICWTYLHALEWMLTGTKCEYISGEYGQGERSHFQNDELYSEYASQNWKCGSFVTQVLWWMLVVILAKASNFGLVLILYQYFEKLGRFILRPVRHYPKGKLLLVMIIYPAIFNALQFWLVDNVIKKHEDALIPPPLELPPAKSEDTTLDVEKKRLLQNDVISV